MSGLWIGLLRAQQSAARYRLGTDYDDIAARNADENYKASEDMYKAMVREGMDKGKAARIAQSKTGKSLATGKKPKGKK